MCVYERERERENEERWEKNSPSILRLMTPNEILLIYPGAVTLSNIETFGYTIIMIFFAILTIGFIFEIGSGVISLSRIFNNKNNNIK